MDYDMFGYGIRDDDYVAVPFTRGHVMGMRIYQYKDGKYWPKLENALSYVEDTQQWEPFPRDISDSRRPANGLRLDHSINLSRFSLWEFLELD